MLDAVRRKDWEYVYNHAKSLNTEVSGTEHEFLLRSQLAALVLKYPFDYREIGLAVSPKQAAIDKFLASEKKCRITNRRFRKCHVGGSRFSMYIEEMRLEIDQILGPIDEKVIGQMLDMCGFGPGSNVGVGGDSTHLGRKFFAKSWSVTHSAAGYFKCALKRNDQFMRYFFEKTSQNRSGNRNVVCYDLAAVDNFLDNRLEIISYNKVSFVTKTAATHRGIAVEPLGNSYVQTGPENYMKHRLRLTGIDLSDQSRNQILARFGSITNRVATVDLTSASDTKALMLVKTLVSSGWFSFLNAIRSPQYKHPITGELVRYEKFVSMGNGFCFPLQTIIFLAAVRAVNRIHKPDLPLHSVYGDDIIVSSETVGTVIDLLKFLGFTPNVDKTFVNGPFRESCGADWYNGQDVRPVYLDYTLKNDVQLRIFHNATWRSPKVAVLFEDARILLRKWHHGPAYSRPLEYAPSESIGQLPEGMAVGSQRLPLSALLRQSVRTLGPTPLWSVRRESNLLAARRQILQHAYALQREAPLQVLLAGYDARYDQAPPPQSRIQASGVDSWGKGEWYVRAGLEGAFDVPFEQFLQSSWSIWDAELQTWRWKEVIFRPVADKEFNGSIAQYWALLLGSPGGELNRRRKARARVIVR